MNEKKDLNDNWISDRLVDLVDIVVSSIDKKSYENEKIVRLCNYMDVYSNDYITSDLEFMQATASQSQINRFRIEKGDVIITKDSETPDDIGIPAVAIENIENLVCGYHLALLKPKTDKIDGAFLAKQLATYTVNRQFANKANGSTRYGLTLNVLENASIPHPVSLDTQRHIAQILTTCDKVIEQTEAVIAKYKAIKQGMLHDLFTLGLDKNGKLRPTPTEAPELYKESELGLIPKEWEVKRLSECCKVPCSYGINAPAVDYDSKLPLYLRITDITEDGFYNKNGRKCVNALNSNQYSLNEDDIVFARTGATVGKTYLYNTEDGKLIYAGFLIKFSPDPNLLNSYLLKSYTETPQYWDWVNIYSQRSGQPGINGNEYASLLLPYPTIDEQNQLANRFTVIDINIKNEVNSFDKYEKIKIGLMNQLLAT